MHGTVRKEFKEHASFECFMLKTFKTMLKINYYRTFVERLGRTKCIVLLSPGIWAGCSALLACGTGEHTWPQPLLTHFSPAAQSWSSRHCSTQTPSRSEKTGLRHLNTMDIYVVNDHDLITSGYTLI